MQKEAWIKSEGTGREVVDFYVCGKQMGEWCLSYNRTKLDETQ